MFPKKNSYLFLSYFHICNISEFAFVHLSAVVADDAARTLIARVMFAVCAG